MRILFVTNFYPPYEPGGQGRSCQEVVKGLQQRGHQTLVLTSRHGTGNGPTEQDGVARALYLEMDFAPWQHAITFFTDRKRRKRHNLDCFRRYAEAFQPDVVFIWGMWNLPRSLPATIESQFPGRILYRFADYWPTLPSQHELYWQKPGRTLLSRVPKSIIGRVATNILEEERRRLQLAFEQAYCVSAATKQTLLEEGVAIEDARIIYGGIDPEKFNGARCVGNQRSIARDHKLLYAGRLTEEKGVDVAIKALAKLVHEYEIPDIILSIAGSGSEAYKATLHELIGENRLQQHVSFLGTVPAEDMPDLYRQHDALLFPSVWVEPFSRTVIEAMASGLAVIASAVGGHAEIIADGENGLLYTAGDSEELALRIKELILNDSLRERLTKTAPRTIREQFTTTRMLDEIEAFLEEIANGAT